MPSLSARVGGRVWQLQGAAPQGADRVRSRDRTVIARGRLTRTSTEELTLDMRATVLVSGVGSVTPFTTPEHACREGLSAGNTWAFLRDHLGRRGIRVFTAPVMAGPGPVVDQDGELGGPFGDGPPALPDEMTINSIDSVFDAGRALCAFLASLAADHGVSEVDVVAHSLGGIFSRNGLREARDSGVPVRVRSFTTLGSPWEPVMLAVPPYQPEVACDGLEVCIATVTALMSVPTVSAIVDFFQPEVFLPWTQDQIGVLDDVAVTMVGGTYFTKIDGRTDKWPNDGFVQYRAAVATSVSDAVLPDRVAFSFPVTHSRAEALAVGEPEWMSLTWNATIADVVAHAISTAGTAARLPNRFGCPVIAG